MPTTTSDITIAARAQSSFPGWIGRVWSEVPAKKSP